MLGNSTHLQVISQQSTQNTANLPLQTCEKTSGLFLSHDTDAGFSSRNNFANLGSFAKVSFPVEFIIPWFDLSENRSCLTVPIVRACNSYLISITMTALDFFQ